MLPIIRPDDLLPSFTELDYQYAVAIAQRGDTYLHVPTLRALTERLGAEAKAAEVLGNDWTNDVVEFGVRGVVTTWGLMAGKPRSLFSVDVVSPPDEALRELYLCADAAGVKFQFAEMNTLELPPVECDLLFIDTLHTYAHLRAELTRHAAGVRRYIAFHDTIAFGEIGMDGKSPGLQQAVEELVMGQIGESNTWKLRWNDDRCNGLAIVERVR